MAGEDVDVRNLISLVLQNIQQPSTVFINNIQPLYRLTKDQFINEFKDSDIKFLNLLRDQLFYIFLDNFTKEVLEEHGFTITHDEPCKHLKKRTNSSYAVKDIYHMGLSIHENKICSELSNEIFKPALQQKQPEQQKQNIIDTNSTKILEAMNKLAKTLDIIQKENKDMKNKIDSLHKKVDRQNETIEKLRDQLQNHSTKQISITPTPPPTPLNPPLLPQIPFLPPIIPPSTGRAYANSVVNNLNRQQPPPQKDQTQQRELQLPQIEKSSPSTTPTTRRNQPIFGNRKSNPNITGPSKPLSLFIGGFNLNLSPENAKKEITDNLGINVIELTPYRTNKYNKSFKVDINPRDKNKAFSSDSWYEGMIVRPFRAHKSQVSQQIANQENGYDYFNESYVNRYHKRQDSNQIHKPSDSHYPPNNYGYC